VIPATERDALIRWFEGARRDLPWRRNRTAWRVLVSELMLQQTRAETVARRFEPFLARFPDAHAMARATEAEVVASWAGLGYYARARSLHRTAVLASALGGLPDDVEALTRLPGIGAYTAGAIASLVFGRAVAAVDGNVARVLGRVLAVVGDAAGRRPIDALASALVAAEAGRAGAWNEALIELGATVCTPRAPTCGACPLEPACAGRAAPHAYGRRPRPKAPVPIHASIALVEAEDRLLWARRAPGGLLGGLWEPPRAEDAATLADLLGGIGVPTHTLAPVGRIVHRFTHRTLHAEVLAVSVPAFAAEPWGPYDAVVLGPPDLPGASALGRKAAALARLPDGGA
jgi:A/G-specific adenine glycosylase